MKTVLRAHGESVTLGDHRKLASLARNIFLDATGSERFGYAKSRATAGWSLISGTNVAILYGGGPCLAREARARQPARTAPGTRRTAAPARHPSGSARPPRAAVTPLILRGRHIPSRGGGAAGRRRTGETEKVPGLSCVILPTTPLPISAPEKRCTPVDTYAAAPAVSAPRARGCARVLRPRAEGRGPRASTPGEERRCRGVFVGWGQGAARMSVGDKGRGGATCRQAMFSSAVQRTYGHASLLKACASGRRQGQR